MRVSSRHVRCEHCGAAYRAARLLSGNTFGARAWSDGYVEARMLPLRLQIPFFRCAKCRGFTWVGADPAPATAGAWSAPPELTVDDLHDALAARIWRSPEEERRVRRLAWWYGNHARRPSLTTQDGPGCALTLAGALALLLIAPRADLSPLVSRVALTLAAVALVVGVVWARRADRQARQRVERALAATRGEADATSRAELDPRMVENLTALWALLDADDPAQRLERVEVARELGRFDDARALLDGGGWGVEEADAVEVLRGLVARRDREVRLLAVAE